MVSLDGNMKTKTVIKEPKPLTADSTITEYKRWYKYLFNEKWKEPKKVKDATVDNTN